MIPRQISQNMMHVKNSDSLRHHLEWKILSEEHKIGALSADSTQCAFYGRVTELSPNNRQLAISADSTRGRGNRDERFFIYRRGVDIKIYCRATSRHFYRGRNRRFARITTGQADIEATRRS